MSEQIIKFPSTNGGGEYLLTAEQADLLRKNGLPIGEPIEAVEVSNPAPVVTGGAKRKPVVSGEATETTTEEV
jgi:hypothetical protein